MNDYTIGAAVDYPLMRIEEMYLIEAEAIGMSQGLAGRSLQVQKLGRLRFCVIFCGKSSRL